MKNKRVILFSFILAIILVAALVQTALTGDNKKQETSSQKVNVGVLQLLSHPALDEIYRGIKDGLAKEGYTDGKQISLDLQNAQGDQSNLALMAKKLIEDNNKVLIGITTPAALQLANQTKALPIVMGGITYPVEAGLIQSEEKSGNNVTGVSDRTPIKQQLAIMKQVMPHLKKIGLLYTASEDNSVKQIASAKEAATQLGLTVSMASISNTNDVQQVTETLASQVDAIFIPIDNTLASAMPTVVKAADSQQVPVFPSADTMVADGGVLGLGVDQYQIGIETAKMVARILKGEKPTDMPVVLANEGVIYLNEAKAKQFNLTIPTDIQEKAVKVQAK